MEETFVPLVLPTSAIIPLMIRFVFFVCHED